ncbi:MULTISPECIES: restriction endonuclease subunit S [unclassified Streptomyces]|uniref:restriction endonuclease subunit S n=1 Tax=unclassified Streptomyces TaxID=2593676 RepID=UPI00211D5F9B|nr:MULTISPECIES: restriction endonuclease subunit S [unclassified Streptomyces]
MEYPLLGVKWYAEGPFLREVVTSQTSKATRFYRVQPGQFIYNRMFAWKGAFGIVGNDLAGSYVSNEFPLFDCDRTRLLPEFLSLYFGQQALWSYVARVSTGTTASRSRWKESQFNDHELALPPVSQQSRIVDVMTAVDVQIEAMKEEHQRSLSLRVALFLGAADLKDVAVEHVAHVSQGKTLTKSFQGVRTGEMSWFKIADMAAPGNEDGYTRANTRMTLEQVESLNGAVVPAGSVVFPRVGAAVLTEKKRILNVDAAVDENHLVLTPREGVLSECLLAAIESIRLADLVQTGAVPSLNMGLIRHARIPWPAKPDAHLNAALSQLRVATRDLREELSRLRTFRYALLTDLLNQEIDIPESYDALFSEVS